MVSQDRDFVIELDGQPGSYRLHVSSPAGDDSMHLGLDPARLGLDLEMLQARVLASATTSRSMRVPELERPLRQVGQALFEAVFQPSVGALFLSSRNEVEREGSGLRIVLRTAPSRTGGFAVGAAVQRPPRRLPVPPQPDGALRRRARAGPPADGDPAAAGAGDDRSAGGPGRSGRRYRTAPAAAAARPAAGTAG